MPLTWSTSYWLAGGSPPARSPVVSGQEIVKTMKQYIWIVFCLLSCSNSADHKNTAKPTVEEVKNEESASYQLSSFERTDSYANLQKKVSEGLPIIVHIFVPLCDNENQGIVPVNKQLGDGQNLRTNLYWGARYGIKSHFNISSEWELLESEKDVSNEILERVVFARRYPNSTKVYLVCDAYRGDKMKTCLKSFFSSIAGETKSNLSVGEESIGIGGNADLLVFNGHNGLMDMSMPLIRSVDNRIRDVSVIGCVSHKYFKNHLLSSKGYPLLMTTNLMAPEAYVVESLIDSWAILKQGKEIRLSAGAGYNKYQKCGIKGATRLFITGW